jgi:hypothetical protein
MGASQDLENEALRRLLVNACYWALGLEKKISAKSNVDLAGEYKPLPFGFGGFAKGVKLSDLAGRASPLSDPDRAVDGRHIHR